MSEGPFLEHDIVMTCRLADKSAFGTDVRGTRMDLQETRRCRQHRIHSLANCGELCLNDVTWNWRQRIEAGELASAALRTLKTFSTTRSHRGA